MPKYVMMHDRIGVKSKDFLGQSMVLCQLLEEFLSLLLHDDQPLLQHGELGLDFVLAKQPLWIFPDSDEKMTVPVSCL